ncbi:MAG: conserved rane protein of unknown function [Candidatus Saccharibacteria bacterium]|nr:conserved rane protein of unknown function [Candidatus Saccharibacteria bacterium]
MLRWLASRSEALRTRVDNYLSRRPHRSFRLTRRRDYVRSLQLPGYWSFTNEVRRTVWGYRKHFFLIVVVYALLTALFVGIGSQETYSALSDTLDQTGQEVFDGNFGSVGEASILFLVTTTGSIAQTPGEAQQVYAVLLGLLTWLTTVWLLRNLLAGHVVRFRDGLYSAGAPLVSTFFVFLVMVVQLLPLALALIGYSAASASGILSGGVIAMMFWIVAGLLAVLSLYWMTSTFIALIVVTLPGMYPMKALRTAGDIVIGRRIRILLRLLWLVAITAVIWLVILLPIILIDGWLKDILPALSWLPIVPLTLLALGSFTILWSASYIYLLYRKVVSDGSSPA